MHERTTVYFSVGTAHFHKHIHRLLNTLRDVNESALLQKIRIDEHSGSDVFEKAVEGLERYLMLEEAPSTFWANKGQHKPAWDEDGGTEQARAILW